MINEKMLEIVNILNSIGAIYGCRALKISKRWNVGINYSVVNKRTEARI